MPNKDGSSPRKAKPKGGRPSRYSQDLADRLCGELADGKSLRTVCKADDMPSKATVFNWMRTNEGFLDQYTRAKQEAADSLVDDMLDIADNDGDTQRDRLRVDTRKWIAAKLKPKKYGDRMQTELTGAEGGPLQISSMSDIETAQRLTAYLEAVVADQNV